MASNSLAAAELLLVVGLFGWFFYSSQQAAAKRKAEVKPESKDEQSRSADENN
ncbi:hypothetical protein [Chromatium okenii]|jgi:predicted negative regulator of RcsB-dependent stress response|uniref:hypothetical protein n=1 Tax=Chromatium okenii TaxID=61644 RepID=UPI0015599F11|nr:hypothetical protein [Chromatium okenii]